MVIRRQRKKREAIIILHEIYGVNDFIKGQCQKYRDLGFEVICPDLLERPSFRYEESKEAYDFFTTHVGFDVYQDVCRLIVGLKKMYNKVFILGFSVGATIAWRCCENPLCSGVVACYGSRIRDYTDLNPVCPTLLLFAKEDSFDVGAVMESLQGKQGLFSFSMDAGHGFMDPYSKQFNDAQAQLAEEFTLCFLEDELK